MLVPLIKAPVQLSSRSYFRIGTIVQIQVIFVRRERHSELIVGLKNSFLPPCFLNYLCPPQLRVNQDEPMEEYLAHLEETQTGEEDRAGLGLLLGPGLPCKEQMRTNVINEIMSTERDYIKHLKDICEVCMGLCEDSTLKHVKTKSSLVKLK